MSPRFPNRVVLNLLFLMTLPGYLAASGIAQGAATPAMVVDARENELSLPIPANEYYWNMLIDLSTFDVDGWNPNVPPGAFLVTGNTMFNFNGSNPLLAIFALTSVPGDRSAAQFTSSLVAEVPEPATCLLALSGIIAGISASALRIERSAGRTRAPSPSPPPRQA